MLSSGTPCNARSVAEPGPSEILEREHLTRGKIAGLMEIDVRQDGPLGNSRMQYATVLSTYCANSATAELETWQLYMRRIMSLVRPGGTFSSQLYDEPTATSSTERHFRIPLSARRICAAYSWSAFLNRRWAVGVAAVPDVAAHGFQEHHLGKRAQPQCLSAGPAGRSRRRAQAVCGLAGRRLIPQAAGRRGPLARRVAPSPGCRPDD